MSKRYFVFAIISLLVVPSSAVAHQPRIVSDDVTEVLNPEVSQSFYGELTGKPAEFRITSDREFRLYVGLLVPDVPGAIKSMSADIVRVRDGTEQRLALLNGDTFVWTQFFETFARDHYFWGPEFAAADSDRGTALRGKIVPAGTYVITVFNGRNKGKYALATGDEEVFPFSEIINAILTIPRIKADFFGYPPWAILATPYGWGYVLVMFVMAFAFGFLYRWILRKFARGTPFGRVRNIGKRDRRVRILLAIVFFSVAVATSWSPWLLFASGFCVFEAIFSWCGLYAAMGRNTCPVA